jgi:peptidoglycan/LPS O-acetylase OafA/YrhL
MAPITSTPRIPSLDGLRAISIGLVLFAHLAGTDGFPVPYAIGNYFHVGSLGVRVFFVISGFLITGLLLREFDAAGRPSLLRFYFRRTLRIFPPYYLFLFVVLAAGTAGLLQLHPGDAVRAFTYTSNYHPERSWYVGHTWSLAVEEQFYLLWPALLLLFGRRRGLWVAAAFVVMAPLIRLGAWELLPTIRPGMGHRFEMVADALATGCVLAGVGGWLRGQNIYGRFLTSRLFVVVPLAVIAIGALDDRPRLISVLGTAANIGIALCIHRSVLYPSDRFGRLLNSRPFVWVGLISYSLYLWQQLFLNRASSAWSSEFPVNVALAFAAATLSYYAVELPTARYRERLEQWLFPRSAAARRARHAPVILTRDDLSRLPAAPRR